MYETIANAVQLGTVNANRKRGRKPKRLFEKVAQVITQKEARKSSGTIARIQNAIKTGAFPKFGFEPGEKR